MKSLPAAVAVAAAALAAPAAAQAATLAVAIPCAVSGEAAPVTGAGFTPGALVALSGDVSGSGTADAAGNLVTQVTPYVTGNTPKTLTVTASEGGVAVAAATFPVVREPFLVEANLNGNPRSVVRWRFAGFPAGAVYGHFRLNGKTVRNYRFGTATGPCGTLSVRARRLPVKTLKYGTYKLKFDNRKSYSATAPGRLGQLSVFRTFRRG